jgi:CBS domain-containing protein
MNAADVMTRHVISVAPDATVEDAVKLMLDRRISGLLVVDAVGHLAGVVTEGDLLRRSELGTGRERSWWLKLLVSPGKQAEDFTRAHGHKVSDVMTSDVVSVEADAALSDIVERSRCRAMTARSATRCWTRWRRRRGPRWRR